MIYASGAMAVPDIAITEVLSFMWLFEVIQLHTLNVLTRIDCRLLLNHFVLTFYPTFSWNEKNKIYLQIKWARCELGSLVFIEKRIPVFLTSSKELTFIVRSENLYLLKCESL